MTQINQEYLKDLEKIMDMNSVDSVSKDYLRYKTGSLKKGPDGQPLRDIDFTSRLGKAINRNDPNMFLNETQSAIEYEVDHYKDGRKEDVEKAIGKNKGKLTEDYLTGINKIIREEAAKIKSGLEEKLKDAPAEQKKQILEMNLYAFVGSLLRNLDLTEGYKGNKDLVEAVTGLKQLQEAGDSERNELVSNLLTEQNGLSDNYKNFRRPWGNLSKQMIANYTRVIGKQLLKGSKANNTFGIRFKFDKNRNIKDIRKIV